jgi:hypothetical protein
MERQSEGALDVFVQAVHLLPALTHITQESTNAMRTAMSSGKVHGKAKAPPLASHLF